MKEIYFAKKRLYAHTSHIVDGDAFIIVEPEVTNDSKEDADVWIDIHMHQLIDNGKEPIDEVPGVMAAGHVKLHVPAGKSAVARTQVCVDNAVAWSPEKPTMYVVECVLYKPVPEGEALPNPKLLAGLAMREPHAMKMLDFVETRYGIRQVSVDSKNGFCIDGNKLELKFGRLDNRTPETFQEEYQRVKVLKNTGANAIQIKGDEVSEFFLDCCDRLGIMVFDEVSEDASVRRDRNHPSIIGWIMPAELRHLSAGIPVGGICDESYGMEGDSFDVAAWYDNSETICAGWDYIGIPDRDMKPKFAAVMFPSRVMVQGLK